MSVIRYSIDSSYLGAWPERVGKFILNFSGVEFESYLWLVHLSEKPEMLPTFAKRTFAKRVDEIEELICRRCFSDHWETSALTAWATARNLAKIRNRIAHNPILFGSEHNDPMREPDVIGIPDMKRLDSERAEPLLSMAELIESSNATTALAKHLEALRTEWCEIRDRQHGT